jgi:hypothetical protein
MLWSVDGQALYNPYGLEFSVPAIMSVHLTIAGAAEAILTGLVVAYMLRTYPHLMLTNVGDGAAPGVRRGLPRGLIAGLAALVLLTPFGLFASGVPFAEWGAEEFGEMIGYVPSGLEGLGQVWKWAPLVDYQLPGANGESLAAAAPAYILSAVVGIGLILVSTMALRLLLHKE